MKLALVGAGTAGERVLDSIVSRAAAEGRSFCDGSLLAFDTDRREATGNVPENRRFLVGDMHPDVRGEGVDGDVDLGVEAAREDVNEIRRAFDEVELYGVDAIMVVAGLGGGTGGGLGSALVAELHATYDKPLYVLGILPADDEGGLPALNASRALLSIVPRADNVVLFDNETWGDVGGYEEMNRELATRIVALFAAGELQTGRVAENLMDPTDLRRTLDTGGVSTIGYASEDLETGVRGLLSWLLFWRDTEERAPSDAVRIKELVEEATESRLTLPCDVSSAERALFVLSGPSEHLSRKGFESASFWLEETAETAEVLAGDEPHENASSLTATVLFSNVTAVPRIEAIQERAVATLPEDQRSDPTPEESATHSAGVDGASATGAADDASEAVADGETPSGVEAGGTEDGTAADGSAKTSGKSGDDTDSSGESADTDSSGESADTGGSAATADSQDGEVNDPAGE